MKKRTGIIGVLVAILALGIGYAVVSAVTLTINGSGSITADQANFKVHYTGDVTVTKSVASITTTASHNDQQTGQFTVSDLTKAGDSVTFTYTIVNDSEGITANLAASSVTTNSNSEYFTVTTSRDASTLAPGASTTETVTVTVAKTPVSADETGTFQIDLVASPSN